MYVFLAHATFNIARDFIMGKIRLKKYVAARYWDVIQRLVLIGWTDDARDLLYVHSDAKAEDEDRHSMQAEVSASVMHAALVTDTHPA